MPKIFVSYRRMDSQERTQRIADWLVLKYGIRNVFIDVDRIPGGAQFADVIEDSVKQSDVVLIVIGVSWVDEMVRRLASPDLDFVRLEVRLALNSDKLIIPVLLDRGINIDPNRLPEDVRDVTHLNYMVARSHPDFHTDMENIQVEIDRVFPRRRLRFAGIALTILVTIGIFILLPNILNPQSESSPMPITPISTLTSPPTLTRPPTSTLTPSPIVATLESTIISLPIENTFDTFSEGWTIYNNGSGIRWESEMGGVNGVVCGTDERDPGANVLYFLTPLQGDLSILYGQTLKYKIYLSHGSNRDKYPDDAPDITLMSNDNLTLTYEFETPPNLLGQWTAFSVLLSPPGWRNDSGGVATDSEMRHILSSLKSLSIRGEYWYGGNDVGCLDNIAFVQEENVSPTQTPVASNADWTPYEQEFDGVPMVLVSAGCFMMGSDNGRENEQAVHEQCFDEPFWIDKYEVTVADYERLGGQSDGTNDDLGDTYPKRAITWHEAQDFCISRGGRLPTEKEWEYAARGSDNLVYPWGNEWNGDYAVWEGNSKGALSEVGSRPIESASWVGAMDMSGNVWEWTSSLYIDYPYNNSSEDANSSKSRTIRGGSYGRPIEDLRSVYRQGFGPTSSFGSAGVRCALSNGEILALQLKIAQIPVASNADWTPYEQEFDGVTMILVPAGCFMMGDPTNTNALSISHEQCFNDPFWIDKYEVTNDQYGSVGCDDWSSQPNQPRSCTDWFETKAFCENRGGRLPTEKEWEYVARGPDNLVYPWGNDWSDNYAVTGSNSGGQTAEVGSRPSESVSWVGAMDMSGNVYEWTTSLFKKYPYGDAHEDHSNSTDSRVLRGGSWLHKEIKNFTTFHRNVGKPYENSTRRGFRCVRDSVID